MSPLIPLIGGAGLAGLGGLFGGNAADLARRRLLEAANMPGLDVSGVTSEALTGALAAIPQAGTVTSKINQLNAAQLAQMLEAGMPGYAGGVSSLMQRTRDYLSGELPSDVSSAVMRATAGRAIGAGYGSGTPFHKALTWRDLGKTSEEGIRYGMQTMMQLPNALPWNRPVSVQQYLGPSPMELMQVRGAERAARQQLLAQAAGMPGQSAVWGNLLGQLGGIGMGYGLQSLLTPKPQWPNMASITAGSTIGSYPGSVVWTPWGPLGGMR